MVSLQGTPWISYVSRHQSFHSNSTLVWLVQSIRRQAAMPRYEPNLAEGLVLQGDALSKCDHILSLQDVPRFQANLGFSSGPERASWSLANREVTTPYRTAQQR